MDSQKNTLLLLEEKLKQAMIKSDVDTLDELLADDLLFTTYFGKTMTKEDDLKSHREKIFEIHSIEVLSQDFRFLPEVMIAVVLVNIQGSFQGQPSNGKFRFTRVWGQTEKGWQVVVGHSTLLSQ